MAIIIKTGRDRVGHLLAVLLCFAATADAAPGKYKAQRFDVIARAVNGDLDVTESITFEFQSGTFTKVWRDLPSSRTDGIQILNAALDGDPITPGDGPGHFVVSGRGRTRVEWHFAETGPSVHRFDLHYLAHGVVYRDAQDDVLRWRALPAEHGYGIDASRLQFEPAEARVTPPQTRRVDSAVVHSSSEAVTIEASGIQSDGWIIAELRYPAGRLAAAQPAWRAREMHAEELAPKWGLAAALIFGAGLFLVAATRQGYPTTSGIPSETTATEPPQPLPAAFASVLVTRGGPSGYQGIGTLLDLADRGVLTIRETRGRLGTRSYELSQVPGTHDLDTHESEVIVTAFGGAGDEVSLSKARGRLARGARRFRAALNADLEQRGLLDPVRKAIRDRLTGVSFAIILAGILGMVAAAPLVAQYEAWPFLLPVAIVVVGIVGLVTAATSTPLSDQGLVEAARWRGFRRHLKSLASSRDDRDPSPVPTRWIVYAIATGLASQWSRYLKRHPGAAPPWFIAAGANDGGAFAAFIGSHAASGGAAGGGAAGGGAAGGGGSGAG
jgi:hypothetical protein